MINFIKYLLNIDVLNLRNTTSVSWNIGLWYSLYLRSENIARREDIRLESSSSTIHVHILPCLWRVKTLESWIASWIVDRREPTIAVRVHWRGHAT